MASKGNNSDVKSMHGGFGAGQIKITPLLQTAVTINFYLALWFSVTVYETVYAKQKALTLSLISK